MSSPSEPEPISSPISRNMQSDDEEERGVRQERLEENESPPDEMNHGTGETTPSNEVDDNGLHHDGEAKTAYYNAAQEKTLSHTEAKMFYQRHQLEEAEAQSPLARSRAYSTTFDDDEGLSRTTSTTSRRSGRGYAQRDRPWRLNTPAPDPSLQSPSISGIDFAGIEDVGSFAIDHADGDEDAEYGTRFGSEVEDHAAPGSDISPELSAISINIRKVLNIRHKYIGLSLQGPNDNPKDGPAWEIYPPPPNPTWDENKNRPMNQNSARNSLRNSRVLPEESERLSNGVSTSSWEDSVPQQPGSPTVKRRKMGHDIGEDFDMKDLEPLPGKDENMSYKLDSGSVYQIFETSQSAMNANPAVRVPPLREFYKDMDEVQNVSSDGPTKSFAYRQLDILEGKFHLYFLVNSYQETADCKRVPHRDFYNVRKVDTHVHHSACMNQKHLLRFIKSKMKKYPDEIVMYRDNRYLTLKQVFESINLTAYDLSIDTLDMHVCHSSIFSRPFKGHCANLQIRLTPTLSIDLISSISNTIQLENRD